MNKGHVWWWPHDKLVIYSFLGQYLGSYHTCNFPHFFSYAARKSQTHLFGKLFLWRVDNFLATLEQNLATECNDIWTPSKQAQSYSLQIYLKFISSMAHHDMDRFISSSFSPSIKHHRPLWFITSIVVIRLYFQVLTIYLTKQRADNCVHPC
jgi:hypothetical protein